jgi:hypothetical protein
LCAALAAFLFCLPAAAGAQEVFSNPARQIEVIGKIKTGQRVVIVPTLMLKWMTYGKVSKTASPHAFQQNTRAARSTTEVVSPADPAAMVQLSQALYMDLVEKLRAAGWEVVTADALAAEQLKWSTIPVDPALGLPSDEFTYDAERRYAIAAPDGMPVLKTVAGGKFLAPGNGMLINRIAKERDAAVLIPTFIFDTAELDQSTRQGFNNVTATTSANAALLIGGSANVSSPRGFMTVAVRQPVTVAEDIGALRKLDARGDDRFTATVRFLGGLAKVSKAAYAVEADSARLQAEALRAGGGFNAEIVARMP